MKSLRWSMPLFIMALLLLALAGVETRRVEAQDFGTTWTGTYFNTADFSGNPVFTRIDNQINFNYGAGSPVPGFVNADNFSVRWAGLQNFAAAGVYRFTAVAEAGIRVTVDGTVIIDRLAPTGAPQTATADVQIAAGTRDIRVDYVALTGNAAVQFFWQPFNVGPTPTEGPSPTPTNPPPTGLPPIPPGALRATVVRAAVLNVRDAPSLGANRVGAILRGQTYAVVGRDANARWFLLQLSNGRAWAYGFYLSVDGNEFNAPVTSSTTLVGIPPGFPDTGVIIVTRAGMRLRGEPNTISPQTGRIPWGSFLPVVGRVADNSWYQVVWKGTIGWVFAGYTQVRQGDLNAVPIR
ncbi:MAG: SH3 domain-containing protein [Anaerolineae bacterium]|nr:SH3 domain-containing protein [Anaerolineae bacterium]